MSRPATPAASGGPGGAAPSAERAAPAAPAAARRLTVGSWPGRELAHNPFLAIFLGALEGAGVRVVDIPTVREVDLRAIDLLLIHWPDKVFWEASSSIEAARLMAGFLAALATRPATTRVVWLVHDLQPHESKWFKRLTYPAYARALSRLVDGALTLAGGTVAPVRAAYPALARKPVAHAWHPLYPDARIPAEARAAVRATFGWGPEHFVYGYCGQLRPYKGVEDLIAAFAGHPAPNARLLVAGRARDAALAALLRGMAARDPRVHLRIEDLSSEQFRDCLGAADLVVAPFRRYLHSGSLVHALSAGRPVLTPATPYADSLRQLVGPDWVRVYEGPLDPSVLAGQQSPGTPLDLSPLAPDASARAARVFFEDLVAAR